MESHNNFKPVKRTAAAETSDVVTDPAKDLNFRLLRLKDVLKLVAMSKTTVYKLVKMELFPQQVELSARCVAWRESDILAWINARPRVAASIPAPSENDFQERPYLQ